MNDFFATLESIIKKIFDVLAGIFKIFENNEEGAEEGEAEGNA